MAKGRTRERPGGLALPILATTALAVLVRAIYLGEAKNPFWASLGLDLEVYHVWAQNILANPLLGSEPFSQAPFYPLALAGAYGIVGPDPVAALWFHLVPAAVAACCVAWVAGAWRGPLAAWAAGLLFAVYKPAIFYTGVLLPPAWVLGLSALLLLFGFRLVRGPAGRGDRLAAGFVLGLLVWSQPTTLVLLPGLLLVDSGRRTEEERGRARGRARERVLRRSGWILLGLALPLAVSFFHNATHGAPSLVSANGGINLYIGNGPEANGAYVRPEGMEENRDLLGIRLAARNLAAELKETGRPGDGGAGRGAEGVGGAGTAGRDVGSNVGDGDGTSPDPIGLREADDYWYSRAFGAMASDPARTLVLFARKLGFYFTQYEIPQVESLPYESRFARILRLPLPGMAALVFLALFGLVLLAREDRMARWVALSVVLLALGAATFFVTARFRVPAVPWLVVLGAGGIAALREEIVGRRGGGRRRPAARSASLSGPRLAFALSVAALGGLASAWSARAFVQEASDGQHVFRLGVVADRSGRTEDAIDRYREALALDPNLAKASVNLGTLLARRGELEEARSYLERGVELDPTSPIAHQNLGQLYQELGRTEDALASFRTAIEAEPDLVSARESAAYLLHQMGRVDESRIELEAVLRRVPRGSPPELRAGTLFSLVAERRSTSPRLRAEGAAEDWSASTDLLRADVLLAQRQIPQAAETYRRLLGDPAYAPYARAVLSQLEASGLIPSTPGASPDPGSAGAP